MKKISVAHFFAFHTFISRNQYPAMKISAAILALTMASASAFAPVQYVTRSTSRAMGAGNTDPVDPTMNGIDDNLGYAAFDPTAGDSPAVARNNNGGVWVQQVCLGVNWCYLHVI